MRLRPRISIAGLLVVVAVAAVVFSLMRPPDPAEAVRQATECAQQVVPGFRPEGQQVHARYYRGARCWIVSFDDPRTGVHMQVFVYDCGYVRTG
jgi:hypothetical protein